MAKTPPRSLLESLVVPMAPRVQFVHGTMPGDTGASTEVSAAATDGASGTVYYQQPLSDYARAHEIGHLFDHQILTDGDRRYFSRLLQVPGEGDWRRGTGSNGMESPSEWFADYYAAAATNLDPRRGSVASYASVGPKRLVRFTKALDRLGRRHGLQPYS